jgi:hypothetical protein
MVAVKSANAAATKSLMIMMQQEATRIRPIVTLAVIIKMLDSEDDHNDKLPPSVMVALKEHDKKNDKIPFYLSLSKNDALTSWCYDP